MKYLITTLFLVLALFAKAQYPLTNDFGNYGGCTGDLGYVIYDFSVTSSDTITQTIQMYSSNNECCGLTTNNGCVFFNVKIDSEAYGLKFEVSGAAGSIEFYNVDCGTVFIPGDHICLDSASMYYDATAGEYYHRFMWCRPGTANADVSFYQTTALPEGDAEQFFCVDGNPTVANLNVTGNSVQWYDMPSNGSLLTSGTFLMDGAPYYATETTDGCESTIRTQVVAQLITAESIMPTDVSSCGGSDGSIEVTASDAPGFSIDGGSTYFPGSSPYTFSGLSAGSYDIYIDGGDCYISAGLITVNEPAAPSIDPISGTGICEGGSYSPNPISGSNLTGMEAFYDGPGGTGTNYGSMTTFVPSVTTTYYAYDVNGSCASEESFTVTVYPSPSVNTVSIEACDDGGGNGTFNLTAENANVSATATYYNWFADAGLTTPIASPSAYSAMSGSAYVLVTDANGCDNNTSVELTVNPQEDGTFSYGSAVYCQNSSNPVPTIIGVPGGVFSGITGINSVTGEIDMASTVLGTYDVTYTTPGACSGTHMESITITPAEDASFYYSNGSYCQSETDPMATITGTSGGTFSSTPGISLNAATGGINLDASVPGTYTITYTTPSGSCQDISTYDVIITASPSAPSLGADTDYCDGDTPSDLSGGSGGTITWYDDAGLTNVIGTGSSLTPSANVGQVTYYATETNNGCTSGAGSVTITVRSLPTASLSGGGLYCIGDSPSDIHFTLTGVAPWSLTYDLDGTPTTVNPSTSPYTITNGADGTYGIVTVSDAYCTGTSWGIVEVMEVNCSSDPCLGVFDGSTLSSTDPICDNDVNGSIDVSVVGGQSPISYSWNTGENTEDLANLQSGNYSILIADANGCDTTLNVTLAPQSIVDFTIATNNASCNNANGSALVSITSGTAPYSYSMTSGDTTNVATDLSSGLYSVTVTDANGCMASSNFLIADSDGPSISENITQATCPDANDGSIDITVSGGTSPYSYSWSDGSTSEDLSGLEAGLYILEVTDNNGCMASTSIDLTGGDPIYLGSFTEVNPSCGQQDGEIAVNATGGNGALSYQWGANAGNQTTSTATGLGAGSYILSVTDANGCVVSQGYSLSNLSGPTVVLQSMTPVQCDGTGGDVDVAVSSGTAPFAYNWNNGSSTQDLSGVSVGVYDLEVTDANGCIAVLSVDVTGQIPSSQTVCLVTVDTTTHTNLLVWEKPITPEGIAYYNIYREGSAAGVFNLMDTVHYSSLSQWTDPTANPSIRGWRYKIGAVDSCGNESQLSTYHKTIHLTINQGLGSTYNLIWDDYIGANFPTWYIERYHPSTGWQLVDSIPSNLGSWTDPAPPTPEIYLNYSVYGVPAGGCTSTKAQDHNSTRSNQSSIAELEGVELVVSGLDDYHFGLYPNPVSEVLNITTDYTEAYTLELTDMHGRVIAKTVYQGATQMDVSGLSAGVYFVKIQLKNSVTNVMKLVKE